MVTPVSSAVSSYFAFLSSALVIGASGAASAIVCAGSVTLGASTAMAFGIAVFMVSAAVFAVLVLAVATVLVFSVAVVSTVAVAVVFSVAVMLFVLTISSILTPLLSITIVLGSVPAVAFVSAGRDRSLVLVAIIGTEVVGWSAVVVLTIVVLTDVRPLVLLHAFPHHLVLIFLIMSRQSLLHVLLYRDGDAGEEGCVPVQLGDHVTHDHPNGRGLAAARSHVYLLFIV